MVGFDNGETFRIEKELVFGADDSRSVNNNICPGPRAELNSLIEVASCTQDDSRVQVTWVQTQLIELTREQSESIREFKAIFTAKNDIWSEYSFVFFDAEKTNTWGNNLDTAFEPRSIELDEPIAGFQY